MNPKTDVEAQATGSEQIVANQDESSPASNEDQTDGHAKKVSIGTRLSTLFSSVRKSISSKPKKDSATDSQAQLQDMEDKPEEDPKSDAKEDVVYSDLDQSALTQNGSRANTTSISGDRTEYAEIQHSK